jgi:hypothetical protein
MATVLLTLVVVMNVLAPAWAARERHPARALKRLVLYVLTADLLYALIVLVVYPRFS